MNALNKAMKPRFALTEIIGDLNGKGAYAQASRLEKAVAECPAESLVKLYDIIMDASYDPLGTFGKEG